MSMETVGTYGAKRQSQKTANPYGYVRRMIDANPRASKNTLREKSEAVLREAISDGDWEMFSAIHEYWFSNCFDNLSKQSAAVARPSREQTADKETPKVAEWRNQIKERFVQFAFLKMVMPNGKTMEDCKGREMTKFGAGAAAVGKAIKPNERVGDKLSETEVRKLFR